MVPTTRTKLYWLRRAIHPPLSQMDLALAAGLTPTRYWRLERGSAKIRPLERKALAKALHCKESALLED